MFGISQNVNIHFIGVGGIGMSGIAEILVDLGYRVSGSDLNRNANVEKLIDKGITFLQGHDEKNVEDAQIIVYSSAINEKNPEIKKARELKLPIIKRAEMLAELMRLKYGIAIAGSHGKTTTTSFISTIFTKLEMKPTCIVGGVVKNLKSHALHGDSQYLIAEADESDGSFLFLNPILSVITNIDNDHLDYYGTAENIKIAFEEFSNKIPFYGCVAINTDDLYSVELMKKIRRPYVTYGINNEADYLAKNISHSAESSKFELHHAGEKHHVEICLSGNHNISNALGAIAIAHKAGLKLADICRVIKDFEGVGRRFEYLHNSEKLIVVDDYGHHPTEVLATIDTAKSKYPNKKITIIFEPHRYSRTKEFWNEFVQCFENIDEAYIAPIYAASEKEILNITSVNLVNDINKEFQNAKFLSDWDHLLDIFEENKNEETIILSMGAGSISKITRQMIEQWTGQKN